jgi:hypothetical protein
MEWQITIDCRDPGLLCRFWAEALGYVTAPAPEGFSTWNEWYLSVGVPPEELDLDGDGADRLMDPNGNRPGIWFQVVPEAKSIKNRVHFDLQVGGGRRVPLDERRRRVDTRVGELVGLGAAIIRAGEPSPDDDHYFVVMTDPEGNEFCVV